MTIVTLGLDRFACTAEQASRLLAAIAPLRQVERIAGHYDHWRLTGAGGEAALAHRPRHRPPGPARSRPPDDHPSTPGPGRREQPMNGATPKPGITQREAELAADEVSSRVCRFISRHLPKAEDDTEYEHRITFNLPGRTRCAVLTVSLFTFSKKEGETP